MSFAAAFDATAFLLAGGQETRLRPAVADRPKPLAPVRGRPFAEWLVQSLAEQGIRRIVFCTGHMADQIASDFGDGRAWGVGPVDADSDGRVAAFAEKGAGHGPGWINAGVYALNRDVLAGIPADAPASLETQVLPALAGRGLWSVAGESPLLDIGTPESYARAEAFLEGMPSR
ncbi:MAG TPA: sugar phosphate nucleotidyltransferase [Thermoanaerobaculia bacterium]|nr:sugar phosphate nucleotidyltransferase [Thermoanaerobaculia bacterium]